jgi:hypothetical protein
MKGGANEMLSAPALSRRCLRFMMRDPSPDRDGAVNMAPADHLAGNRARNVARARPLKALQKRPT